MWLRVSSRCASSAVRNWSALTAAINFGSARTIWVLGVIDVSKLVFE